MKVQDQDSLNGTSVLRAEYSWEDAVDYINTNREAVQGWASDTRPLTFCKLIYKAKWGRIWSLGLFYSLNLLYTRDVIIPNFEEDDFVLIPFWGEAEALSGKISLLLSKAKYPKNIFFLANSEHDAQMLTEEDGVQAFSVSHNAFIDSDVFQPISTNKSFDAVYIGCCRPQKRLNLAKDVFPELLVVTHSDEETTKIVSGSKSIIYSPPIEDFSKLICSGRCGLLLSAAEGGCYASTEYLYCGIPVVSTESLGGRDAYYDDVTAVVVKDTESEIARAVNLFKIKSIDLWDVRNRALSVSDKMLNTLAYQILLPIFEKNNDYNRINPRKFVDRILKNSKSKSSKGRTLFQPENGEYDTLKKIQREQIYTHPERIRNKQKFKG